MKALNEFFDKYSYAVLTIIGIFFAIVWWASALDTSNKARKACVEDNSAAISSIKKDINMLRSKTEWIDRNRQLPQRIARLETKIELLNKQLDRVTNSLDRFNENFSKLEPFFKKNKGKE